MTGPVGLLMRGVTITWDEVEDLMYGLLKSDKAPNGTSRRPDWLDDNADGLGQRSLLELRRHYRR